VAISAIDPNERHGQHLNDFPNLKRWFETVQRRDAVQRTYTVAKTINTAPTVTQESKSILFGQGRRSR
jgi:GST-like protein